VTYPALKLALPLSVALHAAFGVWVEVRAGEREPARVTEPDRFSGEGIDIATEVTPAEVRPAAEEHPRAEPEATVDAPPVARASDPAVPTRRTLARTPNDDGLRSKAPAGPREAGVDPKATRVAPSAGSPSAGSPSSAASPSPAGPFGAAGLPPGVRHLPRAFARAVALANRADPRWRELPAGVVDETSVVLTVADDGTLGALSYPVEGEQARVTPVVRKLLENTVLLLAAGKFSLDASALSPGTMRLRVRVEIEQRAPAASDIDPSELHALDHEPPRPGKAGHGAFTLNSGRRVVAWISLE